MYSTHTHTQQSVKNFLLIITLLFSFSPLTLIGQLECPDNFNLPNDSDDSGSATYNPACGDIEIDDSAF